MQHRNFLIDTGISGAAIALSGVPDGKAVLFLGHWDHLGICGKDGEADRICNGAVDNASGIAVLIEVAKRLASGQRPDRDIYFLATTAEEKGLLGAHYFADHPVVPLTDITVALNVDTIAISPRGTPVATIGRGKPAYDAVVRAAATKLGRKLDEDGEADAFIQRQDGWALGAKGVTVADGWRQFFGHAAAAGVPGRRLSRAGRQFQRQDPARRRGGGCRPACGVGAGVRRCEGVAGEVIYVAPAFAGATVKTTPPASPASFIS